MVQPKYSPEESLNHIKLRMIYDLSKTLNENKNTINEQNNTNLEYFETAVKSIMNNPSQIQNINFGTPTANIKNAVNAIKNSVNGLGTDFDGLNYIMEKGFNNISNSMAIIKEYPNTGKESLYNALKGEWFAGNTTNKIINKVVNQLMQWCKTNKNNICAPKTKEELKYGKI